VTAPESALRDDLVDAVTSAPSFWRYNELRHDEKLARFWCPSKRCNAIFVVRRPDRVQLCPAKGCGIQICVTCSSQEHVGMSCTRYQVRRLDVHTSSCVRLTSILSVASNQRAQSGGCGAAQSHEEQGLGPLSVVQDGSGAQRRLSIDAMQVRPPSSHIIWLESECLAPQLRHWFLLRLRRTQRPGAPRTVPARPRRLVLMQPPSHEMAHSFTVYLLISFSPRRARADSEYHASVPSPSEREPSPSSRTSGKRG
jgi:hypothetical protein